MPRRRLPVVSLLAAVALGASSCGVVEHEGEFPEPTPTPAASIISLTGDTTSVALDEGFVSALEDLEVTPGPVGEGEITDDGAAEFPITGGFVEYYGPDSGVDPFVRGRIEHNDSGLSLTAADGTEVELTSFTIDPGTSSLTGKVIVDGEVAAPDNTPLFFLDGRTLEIPPETDTAEGTVTLTGTTVKLTESAAGLLNQTFGIEDLEAGLVVGVATITANLDPEFD